MAQKVFMTKGDGIHSYSKNSTPQRRITDALVFPILDEVLKQVSLPGSGKPTVVANLGCGSGPNSIVDSSYIVGALRSRRAESSKTTETPALQNPETPRDIQVYFNDLVWNDFNALFSQLCDTEADRAKFFVAGVPGSLFGRLFPQSSVHVFISTYAVHYLSKIPDAVTDENHSAFNGGKLWLHGSTDATAQEYKKQSALDLKSFLRARHEELVPGGLLFFIIKTRPAQKANVLQTTEDSVDTVQVCVHEATDEAFAQGAVTKQQLDALNVPLYYPSFKEELLEIVESFSSSFEILTAEERGFPLLLPSGSSSANESSVSDDSMVREATGFTRGVLGGMFEEVMEHEVHEAFWRHFSRIAEKHVSALRKNSQFGYIAMLKK